MMSGITTKELLEMVFHEDYETAEREKAAYDTGTGPWKRSLPGTCT